MAGWSVEHDVSESRADDGEDARLLMRAAQHPHAGWGVMICLAASGTNAPRDETQRLAMALNAAADPPQAHVGRGTYNGAELDYRVFLTSALPRAIDDEPARVDFVMTVVQSVAVRASLDVFGLEPAAVAVSVLRRPSWPDDDPAQVLARHDPINDRLKNEAQDLSIYLDVLGRGCGITDESFALWLSRLTSRDLESPSVAGFRRFGQDPIRDRSEGQGRPSSAHDN